LTDLYKEMLTLRYNFNKIPHDLEYFVAKVSI